MSHPLGVGSSLLSQPNTFTAAQTFTSIAETGKTTTYNNVATGGIGVIPVYGTPATLTGQSANITATNLYAAAPAGLYRVSYYYMTTTIGNAVTINITLSWNDGTQAQSASGATIAMQTLGALAQGSQILFSAAAQNISFTTSQSGALGAARYSLYAQVEQLQ